MEDSEEVKIAKGRLGQAAAFRKAISAFFQMDEKSIDGKKQALKEVLDASSLLDDKNRERILKEAKPRKVSLTKAEQALANAFDELVGTEGLSEDAKFNLPAELEEGPLLAASVSEDDDNSGFASLMVADLSVDEIWWRANFPDKEESEVLKQALSSVKKAEQSSLMKFLIKILEFFSRHQKGEPSEKSLLQFEEELKKFAYRADKASSGDSRVATDSLTQAELNITVSGKDSPEVTLQAFIENYMIPKCAMMGGMDRVVGILNQLIDAKPGSSSGLEPGATLEIDHRKKGGK
jgi:hypothetical protein